MTNQTNKEQEAKHTEKWATLIKTSAGIFVVALLILAIVIPNPTAFQYWVFRVILALAAAGVGAALPGFITLAIPIWLKGSLHAGGALALFALVYLVNPPQLASSITGALQSLYQAVH